jgi:hypothetical protein
MKTVAIVFDWLLIIAGFIGFFACVVTGCATGVATGLPLVGGLFL